VYVTADQPDTLRTHCIAALLVLPHAAFCGPTAAELYGLPVPPHDGRLHVAVIDGRVPQVRGLVVHRSAWRPDDVRTLKGIPLLRPAPLFFQLAALLGRQDLIIVGDQLTRRWCGVDDLRDWIPYAAGRPGAPLARKPGFPHTRSSDGRGLPRRRSDVVVRWQG
jgi:hypothetical protein